MRRGAWESQLLAEGSGLQRADRITHGAHVEPASGVWLHRACLPRLVFFRNKGDT